MVFLEEIACQTIIFKCGFKLAWIVRSSIINPFNKIRSRADFGVTGGSCSSCVCASQQRIYIDWDWACFALVIVGEVYYKRINRHSWGIDEQAVESIEVGVGSLWAIDSGLGSAGEASLDEILHISWVLEGEGRIGLKSDEDVVGVDVSVAWLIKISEVDYSWAVVVGCGSGSRSGCRSGSWSGSGGRSVGFANRRLSAAAESVLNLARNASSWVGESSITSLISNNKPISALWSADSSWVGSESSGHTGSADGGWWASFAWSRACDAAFSGIEVLSSIAGDWFEDQLLANSISILVIASRAIAAIDFRFVDCV